MQTSQAMAAAKPVSVKPEGAKREAFRRDTLRAWEEYQQTGLHLAGEEVDAWMAKLEAGEDAELPACHR